MPQKIYLGLFYLLFRALYIFFRAHFRAHFVNPKSTLMPNPKISKKEPHHSHRGQPPRCGCGRGHGSHHTRGRGHVAPIPPCGARRHGHHMCAARRRGRGTSTAHTPSSAGKAGNGAVAQRRREATVQESRASPWRGVGGVYPAIWG